MAWQFLATSSCQMYRPDVIYSHLMERYNGQSKRIAGMASTPSRQTKNPYSTQNNPPDSRSQRDNIVAVGPRHSATNRQTQQFILAKPASASHWTRPTIPIKPHDPMARRIEQHERRRQPIHGISNLIARNQPLASTPNQIGTIVPNEVTHSFPIN